MRLLPWLVRTALAAMSLTACTGDIGAGGDAPADLAGPAAGPRPSGVGSTTPSGPPSTPNAPGMSSKPTVPSDEPPAVLDCPDPSVRGTATPGIRRLTMPEIKNTYTDLFAGTAVMTDVQAAVKALPEDRVVTQFTEVSSEFDLTKLNPVMDLAVAVAEDVVSKPEILKTVVGSCAAAAPIADTCVTGFLDGFGALAFRISPFPAEDKAAFLAGFKADGADANALKGLIARLFTSIRFLAQVELGEPIGARSRLTSWEVASRLSYAVTGSMPDATLRAAAARGELKDVPAVTAHAARLLDTTRGRAKAVGLFGGFLGINQPEPPHTALAKQAAIKDVTAFLTEMTADTEDFVRAVVFDTKGGFADLMTSRSAYPRSAAMAGIYGTDVWSGTGPAPAPRNTHHGVAMRAAMLIKSKPRTSPILRGTFIRRNLLCDAIPPPEPLAVEMREEELGKSLEPNKLTSRQLAEKRTEPAYCAACHARINALGFVLEGFDPLGRARTQEIVYSELGQEIGRLPIDTAVPDLRLDPARVTPAAGAGDLAAALAGSDRARECLSRQIFRHSRLRNETPADACLLLEVTAAVRAGAPLKDVLVRSVANEDLFWKR